MADLQSNNKRIAKNTMVLYLRMIATMVVSLYTSRVILNVLGVEDFGTYNVVGGIISMFTFITGGMSATTSRYLTYDLGKGDIDRLKKTFGITLLIHVLLAGIVLFFAESVGIWFLYNKLIIPENRLIAAVCVYQCSIACSLLAILSVPFNAAIIAHEKMSAFAWITISDVILKLLIVYLLYIVPFDKLIIYAILFLFTQVFNQGIYMFYCFRKFEEISLRLVWDKSMFKEMFAFAGWNMYGNLSIFAHGQGLNLLLNMFFGPTVNAARGVAYQVQNIAGRFVSNFQMAVNPQIIKNYANRDFQGLRNLIFMSSKLSFFMLCIICIPIIFEAPYILRLWLKIVPDNTVDFFRIIVLISMTETFVNPISITASATGVKGGVVKKFQVIIGTVVLLVLPISYIVLECGAPPIYVFFVHFVVSIIALCIRLFLIRSYIELDILEYCSKLVLPCFVSLILSVGCSYAVFLLFPQQSIFHLGCFCITSTLLAMGIIYIVGLNDKERGMVKSQVRKFNNKVR